MKMKIVITVLLISVGLSACSNNKVGTTGGSKKTSKQIMQSLQGKKNESFRRGPQRWQSSPSASVPVRSNADYTRTEAKELHGLFPRLPNPDLCMYVFPHLSPENATVPGYTSCFSMYDKNQYALPGEMMATWQHKQ